MTKKRELKGLRFGKLIVLDAAPSVGGDACWLVACDCGERRTIRARSLMSGNTASCGCTRKDRMRSRYVDLVGQVFGRLTVVDRAGSSTQGATWNCLCACGQKAVVAGKSLRSGNSQSCGCANTDFRRRLLDPSFVGQRFGMLTVEAIDGSDGRRGWWFCRCDCGAEKRLLAAMVRTCRVISCGCAQVTKPGLLPPEYRAKSAVLCALRRARKAAAGGTYTVAQVAELYAKQRGRCACCAAPLGDAFERDHRMPLADGGSNDIMNIELLCSTCNRRKGATDPITWANKNGRLL